MHVAFRGRMQAAVTGRTAWDAQAHVVRSPRWPSENEAVTSGKVATNRMGKQLDAIPDVLGIFPDLEPFELLGKAL